MSERGFTLIEVMVALAIATLMMVGLMRSFSLGLTTVGRAREAIDAALIAESTLESIGVEFPLVAGDMSDRVGPYTRHISLKQVAFPQQSAAGAPRDGWQPYLISVTVSWRGGLRERSIHLDTVRLGAAP
jgi:type II secretion system protein I